MKRNSIKLLTAAIMLAGTQQAFAAAGTTAGTTVGNTATVNYTVGGVAQTAETGTASFKVDRLLNVTVAEVGGGYTTVVPGATQQAVLFSVTNNTNDVVDVALSAANFNNDPWNGGAADNFDVSNFKIYVDDGDGIFEDDEDEEVTFLDEMAADESRNVWVVADIPANASNTQVAGVTLTATLHLSDGAATLGALATETNPNADDDPNVVENVFGDGAGDAAGDVQYDGKHSAADAYKVESASITVSKTARVVSDPINGTTNPKAIPGAIVEYCISVSNGGSTAATAVKIDDPIPTNTTYVAGSIKVDTFADKDTATCDYGAADAEDDDTAGADDSDGIKGSFDGTAVHTEVSNLDADAATTTLFRVEVQ